MNISHSRLGKALVVEISGRIDAAQAPLFETHCDKWISEGERAIIFDFEDLEYLSSAGLRGILGLAKRMKPLGGRIVISGARGPAKEIFEIAGFAQLFPMVNTLEDAAGLVL